MSAENLLLISRGPRLSHGHVEIVTSPQQDQDIATVQVIVGYFEQDVRDEAKVCYIRRGDGEIGVGIFVSNMKLFVITLNSAGIIYIDPRAVLARW